MTPVVIKAIPGFPGYRISNTGFVQSCCHSKKQRNTWRDLRPYVDRRGRVRYTLRREGKSWKCFASVLVLETFVGPCPPGLECCHNNGNDTDNCLENLRWDSHSANLLDRRGHGTAPCGEMIWTAKLTADEVREIRHIGYPLRQHAERYGVSEVLVSLILRRKVWQHV